MLQLCCGHDCSEHCSQKSIMQQDALWTRDELRDARNSHQRRVPVIRLELMRSLRARNNANDEPIDIAGTLIKTCKEAAVGRLGSLAESSTAPTMSSLRQRLRYFAARTWDKASGWSSWWTPQGRCAPCGLPAASPTGARPMFCNARSRPFAIVRPRRGRPDRTSTDANSSTVKNF
jgi:hypothetical protein